MVADVSSTSCLSEDELLALADGALADAPDAEAHLATCATCSALLAGLVQSGVPRAWNELAGTMLGPYRIDAQIGAGGMGAVYRAWDPRLGRAIAVKVLHAGGDRLPAEARAAAAIDHRAIVGIHDVGVAEGIHYVAMELVDGESLRSVLGRGRLGVARARELFLELVDALAAAHARGVVHRDLKPENLVLAKTGLRILDFGLATVEHGGSHGATEPGAIHGTAGYMAPEQARGDASDARIDLFAAGAIAYEIATGKRAFPGASNDERLSATLSNTPATDELGELGPILARCLAKEPVERFQSAADLAWALRGLVARPAGSARPSRRMVLAAGASTIAAAALGVVLGRRGRRIADVPEIRTLTHRPGRVFTARFTSGGDHVVYGAQWNTDPIAIYEIVLASSETNLLELPSADLLAVSRKNELAASVGHAYVDHQSSRGTLTVVSLAGGAPRPLADDVEAADFLPEPTTDRTQWTPGGTLAAIRATPSGFRVELPLGTTLVNEPANWITHLRVSPDGRYAAYLRHPHTNHDGGELVVADIAAKTTRTLSSDWLSIPGLAWDPDGESLWFSGWRESLPNQIHRITLDGELAAVPEPTAERIRLHDVAADRRLLATIDSWRLRAMAGDQQRGLSQSSYVSDLSADGRQIVICEQGEPAGAYLVPYDGGRALRLGPGNPLGISPSGERIAARVDDDTHLMVYSTRSGESLPIRTPGSVRRHGRWIDERSLLGVHGDKLWRLSLDAEPVALVDTAGSFELDPARRRCAYLDRDRTVCVLELASGRSTTLPIKLVRAELCGWLAEPDAIAVRSTTTPIVVDRIDPSTGTRTHHRTIRPPPLGLKAVDTFVLHADGERFAYSYGEELSQLVVIGGQAA